ncbi:hypothetical protein ACQ4XT_12745 [Halobacillus faecis]
MAASCIHMHLIIMVMVDRRILMEIGVILWKVMPFIHTFLIHRATTGNQHTNLILIRAIGHSVNGGTTGRDGKTSDHLREDLEDHHVWPHGRRIGWIALSEEVITVSGTNGGMAQPGGTGKT